MLVKTIKHILNKAQLTSTIKYPGLTTLLFKSQMQFCGIKQSDQPGKLQDYIKCDRMVKLLQKNGINSLFRIQEHTYQDIYDRKDLIAGDKTGSGKTLAFTLPVIERMRKEKVLGVGKGAQFLVLAPTRELATQIFNQVKLLKHYPREFEVITLIGKTSLFTNKMVLEKNPEIIIGTPGRIKDLMDKKWLNFSNLQTACIDEADFMFDIGFKDTITDILEEIHSATNQQCQYLCFTATLNKELNKLTENFMKKERVILNLNNESFDKTPRNIEHIFEIADRNNSQELVNQIIEKYSKGGRVIIFTNTKRQADELPKLLDANSVVLHGDIEQSKRFNRLQDFKGGNVKILIATNVAARGLDIPNVELVINLDKPSQLQSYIHRSGRTARAGKSGTCVTIFPNEKLASELSRILKQKYEIETKNNFQETEFRGRRSSRSNLITREPRYQLSEQLQFSGKNMFIMYDRRNKITKEMIVNELKKKNIKGAIIQVDQLQEIGCKVYFVNLFDKQKSEQLLSIRVGPRNQKFECTNKNQNIKNSINQNMSSNLL